MVDERRRHCPGRRAMSRERRIARHGRKARRNSSGPSSAERGEHVRGRRSTGPSAGRPARSRFATPAFMPTARSRSARCACRRSRRGLARAPDRSASHCAKTRNETSPRFRARRFRPRSCATAKTRAGQSRQFHFRKSAPKRRMQRPKRVVSSARPPSATVSGNPARARLPLHVLLLKARTGRADGRCGRETADNPRRRHVRVARGPRGARSNASAGSA